jgi:hypothetical protein
MMSRSLTVPLWIAPLGLAFWSLTAPAVSGQSADQATIGQASTDDVFKRIPLVSSDPGRSRNIKLGGYMAHSAGAHLAFLAQYRAPGQFALRLVDETTQAPLACIADNRCLVYDPVRGGVFFFAAATFECSLVYRDGRFNQSFSWVNAGGRSKILLAGKTLFTGTGRRAEIAPADGGDFRLTATTDAGDSLVAIVAPSRRWQIRQLELVPSGMSEPQLGVRDLSVDERSAEPWPHVPPKARCRRDIHLEDCSGPGVDRGLLPTILDRAFCARLAMQNKELRPEFERRYGVSVDWNEAEIDDRRLSAIVRRLMQTAGEEGHEARPKGGVAIGAR